MPEPGSSSTVDNDLRNMGKYVSRYPYPGKVWRQRLGEDFSDYLNRISTEMVAYLPSEIINRPSHLKHTVHPSLFIDHVTHLPRPSSTFSRHGIALKTLSIHTIHPCVVVLLFFESQYSVRPAPSPPDDLFVTSLVSTISAPLIILVIFHAPFSTTSSTRK